MGAVPGILGQQRQIQTYDLSGTITTGGTSQLITPIPYSLSSFLIQNISTANMWVEFGGARATATLSNGTVASCAITNAGFGYSKSPKVIFYGGGYTGNNQINPSFLSAGLPSYQAPTNIAQAYCVMTGSAPTMKVSSIVIENAGSGYNTAPLVYLQNDPLDPFGCADPFYNSVATGYELLPQASISADASVCPTDQIAVYCPTTGAAFTAKFTI